MAFTFPNPDTTPEFTGDNGITYSWDATDGKWIIKGYSADFDDRYVKKKGGDSMEGPLNVTGLRSDAGDGLESTVITLNVDSGQNSALHLRQNGTTKVYVGNSDFTVTTDLKFSSGGKAIYASGPDKNGFVIDDGGVFYDGDYTQDRHITTKKNLDDTRDFLQNEIVELEQELEALAPSVERGNWKYSDTYSKPVGYYGARTGGGLLPTGWDSIGRLTFNEEDETRTTHTFTDIKDGTYIQLFEQGSETAALFQATGVATRVDGDQLHIDVTHVQSVSGTTPQPDKSYRFKIFELTDDTDTTAFVLKTGDSMSGRLLMEDANIQINADDLNKSYIDFRRPSGEFITAVNFVHNGTIPNTIGGYDINLQGYTSYNRLRLTGRNSASNPLMFEARADGTMGFYYSVDFNNKKITNLGDPVDDPDAANKKYVDDRDEVLRQDIIELEEEINAIAPSVEYGTWEWKAPPFNNTASPPDPGTFFLLDISRWPSISYTDEYAKATRIAIHNNEYVPDGSGDPANNHTWADADVGKLIQLFDAADPDFLLGKITAKDTSNAGYTYLDVELIQTAGVPNDNTDTETGKYLTRINIFDPPTGGDVSGFVLKTGDTMTGTLNMDGDAAIKTRNLDSGQNSNLEIKHNGVSKVYVGADQTAFQHHIKFAQTGKQVYAGTDLKGLAFYADGVQYVGNYTADKHVATKKNVEEAIYHNPADTSTNKYVDRSGDTMSGDLEIKTPDWGEAALILNGKRDNTSNASTTISFKNQLDTADAYSGYLTYRSTGSAAGFFRFNRNLDLNGQRLTMLASPSSDNDAANKKYVDDTLDFNKYPELS